MPKAQPKIIRFVEEGHKYYVDGMPCPGVSGILENSGLVNLDAVKKDVLARASEFGTHAHDACLMWDNGTLDITKLDKELVGYVKGWANFCMDEDFEIEISERIVYSGLHHFIGRPDRIGKRRGKKIVADIKTSTTIYPYYKMQVRGYKVAYNEGGTATPIPTNGGHHYWYGERPQEKVQDGIIVQLLGDGKYKMVETKPVDESAFLAAVTLEHWRGIQ